ncbi:unnamed protein product [Allacma fusca]|uniref:Uncharacterized protein n=1 Tax=Allacma fusca TaxID=39272 RepID=A0A8J2PHY3_9HEXA|nr:unnamed protein product [Allacma fusca]
MAQPICEVKDLIVILSNVSDDSQFQTLPFLLEITALYITKIAKTNKPLHTYFLDWSSYGQVGRKYLAIQLIVSA